jgi:hypothetical protein
MRLGWPCRDGDVRHPKVEEAGAVEAAVAEEERAVAKEGVGFLPENQLRRSPSS